MRWGHEVCESGAGERADEAGVTGGDGRSAMNSRERVAKALDRGVPDRVPLQVWLTPEMATALQEHYGLNDEDALWDEFPSNFGTG